MTRHDACQWHEQHEKRGRKKKEAGRAASKSSVKDFLHSCHGMIFSVQQPAARTAHHISSEGEERKEKKDGTENGNTPVHDTS